jgi:tRNA A37 threonylcarbamoyladenosine modification protein TsaB
VILSFNTIFEGLNIILQEDSGILSIENIESKKQSEILVASIESTLKKHNLDYKDIDVFSSLSGPGNFTGIKTSLAVLKAISIALDKNIVLLSVFDVISHGIDDWDLILLDMGSIKYYVKYKNGTYGVINKKDFINDDSSIILTNNTFILGENIIHSVFTNEKWAELIVLKVKKNEFSNDKIEPLYIEEALITERKK